MTGLFSLIKRNCKLFFKDKGMFFCSLITPIILLVLYITFLASVYEDSFNSALNQAGASVSQAVIDATVGGQLVASLLAVCCITVAFCANLLMVQDKVNSSRNDLLISPVKKSTLAVSYYVSTLCSTFLICFVAMIMCFIYLIVVGWYISFTDILLITLDVFLLTMFGTALSSIINIYLNTQGQMSAVATIVSAFYGFICGAYMPMSQFGETLQKVLSFLPGTYGTALLKIHAMQGAFEEMVDSGFPPQVIEGIKDSVDCNVYFFDTKVSEPMMYLILGGSVVILLSLYILLTKLKKKNK